MADIKIEVMKTDRNEVWVWWLIVDGKKRAIGNLNSRFNKPWVVEDAESVAALIPGCRVEVRE